MAGRRGYFAVAAFLLMVPGCACPWGSCRAPDGNAGNPDRTEAAAAISRNVTDAEILVEDVEVREGTGYVVKGTVVSAAPVGGRTSIAETGQSISLTPWYPGGTPDLSTPAHKRLAELSAVPRGSRIRCRIALDDRGAWRIISAE